MILVKKMLADFLLMEQLFLGFRSLGVTWIKPRQVAGFFASRHLGLAVRTFTLLEDSL
jgi:hypothetical protein